MPRPPGSNLSPNEVPTNPDPTNAIAAANQTVNTLLGRSAKSWMQDAGHAAAAQTPSYGVVSSDLHPKKRRVRPPKNKPTEHLQVPQNARQNPAKCVACNPLIPWHYMAPDGADSRCSDESVLPSPALTNEPSPSASALYLSPNMTPTTIPSAGIPPGGYTQRPQAGTTPHQQNTGSTSHDKRRRDPDGMDPRVSLQSQKRSRLTENPPDADVPRAEPQQKEMDQYASSLQQRINSIGGLPSLEKTTEQPRYRFLQEACSQRDGFYVVLHQVFCLWSYEKSFRYSVSSPTLPIPLKDADRAFTLLLQILKPNTTMAMEHLSWFSLFPTPISENVPPLHRTVMPQINHFLARLANTWPPLIESVRTREYPVSAHELIHGLGCHSPVLRGFLFTVSRRALAVHDRVSHNLNSFFSRDESTELRAAAGQPGGRDMESSRNELIIRYRSLVHQARRRAVELGTLLFICHFTALSLTSRHRA